MQIVLRLRIKRINLLSVKGVMDAERERVIRSTISGNAFVINCGYDIITFRLHTNLEKIKKLIERTKYVVGLLNLKDYAMDVRHIT